MRIANNMMANNTQRQEGIVRRRKSESAAKLSSGLRISVAADDSAGLAISEKMRAQIRGLYQASTNVRDGISLVQTGDGAMEELKSILQRIRELSVQAVNDTNESVDREAIQLEISSLVEEINTISNITSFNSRGLLNDDWEKVIVSEKIYDFPPFTRTVTESTKSVIYTLVNKNDGSSRVISSDIKNSVTVSGSQSTYTDEKDIEFIAFNSDGWNVEGKYGFPLVNEISRTVDVDTTRQTDIPINDSTDEDATDEATAFLNKVEDNGYPQFQTTFGNSAISLACAMTKLDIMVGGPPEASLFDYVYSKTTFSNDGKTATTVYFYNDIEVTQTITLEKMGANPTQENTYKIEFSMENKSGTDKTVSLKFAYDALNGYNAYSSDSGATYSNVGQNNAVVLKGPANTTKAKFKFQDKDQGSENVSIYASSLGSGYEPPTQIVLDNIETLHNSWDYQPDNTSSQHSAVGLYWEDMELKANTRTMMGLTYGEAEFSFSVQKTTSETVTIQTTTNTKKITDSVTQYEANYLHIQSGPNADNDLKIPLLNLSAEMLKIDEVSVLERLDAIETIDRVDAALSLVSTLQAVWGAYQNRMEHIYDNNMNSHENLAAAESLIRDIDIAKELTEFSKAEILSNAATAMLSQANQNPQNVLKLLT